MLLAGEKMTLINVEEKRKKTANWKKKKKNLIKSHVRRRRQSFFMCSYPFRRGRRIIAE